MKNRLEVVITSISFIEILEAYGGKCGELEILFETEINNVEVLCVTEHWLNCHKIHAININHFIVASAFCRKNSDHGGSCFFVKKGVMTKVLNSVKEFG